MARTATYIKDIVIQDPDLGGDVDITFFKHENGGIFGIDASYIDQVVELDDNDNETINDPLADLGSNEKVTLLWPEENI